MKTSLTPRSDSQLTVLVMSPSSASASDATVALYNNTVPEELYSLKKLLFPRGTTLLLSKGPLSLTVIETSGEGRQLRVFMSNLRETERSRVLTVSIEELRRYFGIGSESVRTRDASVLRLGRLSFFDYVGPHRK